MRQGSEAKVKVVFNLGALEAGRLGDGRPDLGQVLNQCRLEVRQGRGAEVVSNNEEEERSRGGPGVC